MRKVYVRLALMALQASMAPFAAAQLSHSPAIIAFPGSFAAGFPSGLPETLDVVDIKGAHVKFKYAGAETGFGTPVQPGNNFLVVIPSSGTTPASVQIAVNPNVAA